MRILQAGRNMSGRSDPHRARVALSLLASVALAGCQNKTAMPNADAAKWDEPIVGLSSGEGVTFTRSPDGRALSILYDLAEVRIASNAAPISGEWKTQARRFALVLGQNGLKLRVHVRGFRDDGPGDAQLKFSIGSKSVDLSDQLTAGTFAACFETDLADQAADVAWSAGARQVQGKDRLLVIDSIDISAQSAAAPAAKAAPCPEVVGQAAGQGTGQAAGKP